MPRSDVIAGDSIIVLGQRAVPCGGMVVGGDIIVLEPESCGGVAGESILVLGRRVVPRSDVVVGESIIALGRRRVLPSQPMGRESGLVER